MTNQPERTMKKLAGHLTGVPLILALLSVLIFVFPGLTGMLQFDVGAIGEGELWRLLTGHFTHWDLEHLFWDVLMFASLGIWCYKEDRKGYFLLLILVPLLTSLATFLLSPNMYFYRGLSGIDTGLFVFAGMAILQKAWQKKNRMILVISLTMLVLLAAKTAFELCTGTTIFVSPAGYVPAPLSHLAGIVVGGVLGLIKISSEVRLESTRGNGIIQSYERPDNCKTILNKNRKPIAEG